MAEIRCPMCGKSNPAERDTCQYCQARLKPLQIPNENSGEFPQEPAPPPVSADTPSEEQVPEWLASLRSKDTEFSGEEPDEDLPDWLTSAEGETDESAEAIPAGELPDWLTNPRDETSQDESFPALRNEAPGELEADEPSLDADLPDWLSAEQPITPAQEEAAPPPAEEELAPADEPEWLQRIRARQHDQEAEQPSAPDKDILQKTSPFAQDEIDLEYSDWLKQIEQDEAAASEQMETTSQQIEDQAAQEPGSAEPGETKDMPKWLTKPVAETDDAEPPAEDLPEWLKTGESADQPENAPLSASSEPEIPDWLEDFKAEEVLPPLTEAETPSADLPEEALESAELPDWLAAYEQDEAELPEMEDDSLPDWLKGSKTGIEASEQPDAQAAASAEPQVEPEKIQAEPEEIPAWLEKVTPSAADQMPEEEPIEVEPVEPADLDWLEAMEASAPELPYEPEATGFTEESGPVSPFAVDEEEDLEAIETGEIPDWLTNVKPGKAAGQDAESGLPLSETEGEPGLAPAELPSWLEAMRPVQPTVGEPAYEPGSDHVENIGPLAGLRGVLPAEPDISQIGKPPAYQLKLHISDTQQASAELFTQLLKTEGETRPIPKRAVLSSQHILRFAIFVVMLAAVLWPLVMGTPFVNLPIAPPETQQVYSLIGQLSSGSPVLLAVDYEPGWSGEMDAAATAMVKQLKQVSAFPVLVSTTPTGPAQAERLIQSANVPGISAWFPEDQYINLGFIPGGAAGLLSFAQAPRQIMPYDLQGHKAWESEALKPVQSLQNFAMLIVVTESPDTARAWIEQVQPGLGKIPLLMVVSAQAEPLVRPYIQAGAAQVQGLVTGVAGGAAYENLSQNPGPARAYWNAFSLGLLVAAGLILIGGLVNAGQALIVRRRASSEGEG